ncbi:MAG: nuclear transport factor 2 family protein [Candidatus Zixiibacteriota bacterium]|nr:MAG: nuclear transport factor 2 family protein [candidate division Zixibacteria bacterium]
MKRWVREVTALICVLLLCITVSSCSRKPLDVVKAYQHAYNSHDLGQLLPLIAEEATFQVPGHFDLKGKNDIRLVAEYDFALNIQMTLDRLTARGDTVYCELVETNDWLEAAGIDEAYYKGKFVIGKGLIRHIRGEATRETQKAFQDVLNPLLEWASEERPEQLAQMMQEGKFVYNAENAKKSLALLKEWREVTEPGSDE